MNCFWHHIKCLSSPHPPTPLSLSLLDQHKWRAMPIIWYFIIKSGNGIRRSIRPHQFNIIDCNTKSAIQFVFTWNGICWPNANTAAGLDKWHSISDVIDRAATFSYGRQMVQWLSTTANDLSLSYSQTNRSGYFVDNENARTHRICIESTENKTQSGEYSCSVECR